jgi:dephospho-CoA kinase
MIIIGLTGSIGMGKSTVAGMFERLGVPVFDADAAVRAMQGPGGRALPAIEAAFPGTTGPAGLDRARLGAQVFGNPALLRRLEAILHPLVSEAQSAFLGRHRLRRAVVLDVPLLFEKGGWRRCDLAVVVSAPLRVQRARVLARPGMTREKFMAIVHAQMADSEKRNRADIVIETGRGRRATWNTVRHIVAALP